MIKVREALYRCINCKEEFTIIDSEENEYEYIDQEKRIICLYCYVGIARRIKELK